MSTLASLLVRLGIDASDYQSGIRNAADSAERFVSKSQGGFSSWQTAVTGSLMRVGEIAVDTALKIGGALLDQGAAALTAAGQYEQNLDVFQSVTDATDAQMEQLGATAKLLGADMDLPGTSAAGAAAAMLELGKAGLSVDDVLSAAKGTLQLSAAGLNDNALAAEITANALMSFGLAGDKASFVADQLAAVANKSSVEVKDVADSLRMAGSVFAAFQGPVVGSEKAMTQLNAAIGLLGNVGIKGGDAGTSLKQMLLQLTGPSQVAKDQMKALYLATLDTNKSFEDGSSTLDHFGQVMDGTATERGEALKLWAQQTGQDLTNMGDIAYDAAGKMRSFPEIIDLVSKATKGMSDESRNAAITNIFGADASRAVIALMQAGPAAFDEMTASITRQGAAGDAAAAQNKGLLGAMDGLTSVWETLQLAMAEPLLEPVAAGIRSFADGIAAAQPMLISFVETAIVPAIKDVAAFLQSFVEAPDKIAFLTDAVQGGYDTVVGYITDHQEEWANIALGWLAIAGGYVGGKIKEYTPKVIDGLLSMIPGIIIATGDIAVAAISWLAGEQPKISASGNELFDKIGKSFEEHLPDIGDAAGKMADKLATVLIEKGIPALGVAVVEMIAAFGRLLIEKGEAATEPGTYGALITDKIREAVMTLPTALYDIGKDAIGSFFNGITDKWNEGISAITGLWDQIPQGIRDTLQMHSPSKVLTELGSVATESFVTGGLLNYQMAQAAAASIGAAMIPPKDSYSSDFYAPETPMAVMQGVASQTFTAYDPATQVPPDMYTAPQVQAPTATAHPRASSSPSSGGASGGGNTYYVTIEGSVLSEKDLFERFRNWLDRKDRDNRAS